MLYLQTKYHHAKSYNIMKKIIILWTLSLCLLSCTKDILVDESPVLMKNETRATVSYPSDLRHLTPKQLEQRRVNLALLNYVYLEDNQYVIRIKPEVLKELNISEQSYLKAVTEINETNELISNAITKGESIYLTDTQTENVISLKSSPRSDSQSGNISTTGNEFGQDAFYPAYGMNIVRFFCRTNVAMLPIYTCKTEVWNTWQVRTAVGALGRNTEIDVPLNVSGSSVCATLYFQTSDSNGGSAYWRAINTHI